MFSLAEENYLKAIYHLSGHGQRAVLTNELAAAMQTRAASVTDMIKKLSAKSLIRYERYHGVEITAKGRNHALMVIRKHRLWETFLVSKLGLRWDEVHEVAEQLEHIQSTLLVNKLEEYLDFPTVDPHGDPIPDRNGKINDVPLVSLSELAAGARATISCVKDSDPALLQFLEKIGAKPGKKIQLVSREPYDQSLEILLEGKKVFISLDVSRNILMTTKG